MCPPNVAPTPAGPKRHKSLKCSISDRGQNRPPQQAPHGWQPFLQLFYFQLPNIHLGNEITHSFLLGVGLLPLTAGPVVRFFSIFSTVITMRLLRDVLSTVWPIATLLYPPSSLQTSRALLAGVARNSTAHRRSLGTPERPVDVEIVEKHRQPL